MTNEELARKHADAYADTGDGFYSRGRGYKLDCIWCDWTTFKPSMREAVKEYDKHAQTQYQLLRTN